MGEKIDNWQEWTGSALVGVAITGYLYKQYASRASSGAAEAVDNADAAAAAEPLLANSGNAAGAGMARAASTSVPMAGRLGGRMVSGSLDQAAIAATPGSMPSLSFRRYVRPTSFNVPRVQEV